MGFGLVKPIIVSYYMKSYQEVFGTWLSDLLNEIDCE